MGTHIFGIRHHGPGSARSLRQALTALKPDIVLVEGPPEAEAILPLLADKQMKPPVAMLLYVPDQPQRAVYYPFAVFSPEWQALDYALTQQIPIRLMDLPQAYRLADEPVADQTETAIPPETQPASPPSAIPALPEDPLTWLATAAGYNDSERWWDHLVEQRQNSQDLFAAILEAMTVLRSEFTEAVPSPWEAEREAYMRQTIRTAQKEGFQRIAIVCGAWHAPALVNLPDATEDNRLLKGLAKVPIAATWVPWTYGRLLSSSGYGAGIEAPGWYHHLWEQSQKSRVKSRKSTATSSVVNSAIHWMARVAKLLRKQDLDASSASVIEAVRLAEALAALRDRPLPGLPELNEATQTVLCFGDPLPMQLIHHQLIVGERLGKVPSSTPMVPLQQDLQRQQKRLRLAADATASTLELDLRKPLDLERSQFLHQLALLDLPWGHIRSSGRTKGTFRETWQLQWKPEFSLQLIEVGIWGNTIAAAATTRTCDRATKTDLPGLTTLIDQVILSNLPEAIDRLMHQLQSEAALASDITHLMQALPPLVNILRYGNVRQVETAVIAPVVDGLVARICIGLPPTCASLDDDAAAIIYKLVVAVHSAIGLLQNSDHLESWQLVLSQMADQQGLHGLLAGRCCRLLFESGIMTTEDTARRLNLALSLATEPAQAAAWVEGFLSGSAALLLHHRALWQVLDDWLIQLPGDTFTLILPLLRRTFATFAAPERRQMGERVRQGHSSSPIPVKTGAFDLDRADTVLPLLAQLLGLSPS